MTLLVTGRDERIEYKNVSCIEDDDDTIRLIGFPAEDVEVLELGHLIGRAELIEIEKRCLVTNEVYIDTSIDNELPFQ